MFMEVLFQASEWEELGARVMEPIADRPNTAP